MVSLDKENQIYLIKSFCSILENVVRAANLINDLKQSNNKAGNVNEVKLIYLVEILCNLILRLSQSFFFFSGFRASKTTCEGI